MEEIKDQTPQQLLNEVENFSRGKLNRKDDLRKIFNAAFEKNVEHKIAEVSFTAKYIQGLYRVLKSGKSIPEVESLEHVKKDLSENIIKVKEEIKEIISGSNSIKFFEQNYFEMTQPALLNLNELLTDLEWTKMYLNSIKRESKN